MTRIWQIFGAQDTSWRGVSCEPSAGNALGRWGMRAPELKGGPWAARHCACATSVTTLTTNRKNWLSNNKANSCPHLSACHVRNNTYRGSQHLLPSDTRVKPFTTMKCCLLHLLRREHCLQGPRLHFSEDWIRSV